MNIDIQEETESKYVIHSLQVMHMATSMKKMTKNKFITIKLNKSNF